MNEVKPVKERFTTLASAHIRIVELEANQLRLEAANNELSEKLKNQIGRANYFAAQCPKSEKRSSDRQSASYFGRREAAARQLGLELGRAPTKEEVDSRVAENV